MSRSSLWIGFLAGGWVATIAMLIIPSLGFAEDPPMGAAGVGPSIGPSVNPIGQGGNRSSSVAPTATGTSDSNNHAIALAASIGGGESAVYYFDTAARRLLVFQYKGIVQGSKPLDSRDKGGLRLLAARHFDYDLRLEGYRDLSQRTRSQLKDAFEDAFGGAKQPKSEGFALKKVEVPGGLSSR